jgi:hypothetical protein
VTSKTVSEKPKINKMNESQSVLQTIDEYIAGFPEDIQETLQVIRQTIHEAAPEAMDAMSYQMPTFMLNGKSGTFRRI